MTEYWDISKKILNKFGKNIEKSDEVISYIANAIMMGDWRWNEDYKSKDFGSETWEGKSLHIPSNLRSSKGESLRVESEWRLGLLAGERSMLEFDPEFTAPTLALSKDRMSVTCVSSEVRGISYSNVGFCTGKHYWEVKIEGGEPGKPSIYVGVAAKPVQKEHLNRWNGMGFVNFRATASGGAERIYGAHYNNGDIIGISYSSSSTGSVVAALGLLFYRNHEVGEPTPIYNNYALSLIKKAFNNPTLKKHWDANGEKGDIEIFESLILNQIISLTRDIK